MKGGLTVPAKRWKDNLKKLRNNKRNDVRLKIKLYVKIEWNIYFSTDPMNQMKRVGIQTMSLLC